MQTVTMCYIVIMYKGNGKENGNYDNWLYKSYKRIMEKNMETTVMGYIGLYRSI